MALIEFINISLFVFWAIGCVSVLVDYDHIWGIANKREPINLAGRRGRPFHNVFIFIIYGIVCGWFIVTFIYGPYAPFYATEMATAILIYVNILTIIIIKLFDKKVKSSGWYEQDEEI